LYHEITYDAVMKKTPPPPCPPFERSVGAMPSSSGVPAYRYQQPLPCCITCQDVFVQQSNGQKRINYRNLKWTLEICGHVIVTQ